jgi:tellurite methyltransferase
VSDLQQKWDARYLGVGDAVPHAARVLADNLYLLPAGGVALDLACGLGGNALLMAERGMQVAAWDVSPVAIARLRDTAATRALAVDAQVRDVLLEPPAVGSWDVIVVSHFLERSLAGALTAALRPGGLLYYQTFTLDGPAGVGPSNPSYRLGANELLRLFPELRVLVYREDGVLGDLSRGLRGEALLVGCRP